jgi:4-carboxymuconolactone decarboxylase
MLSPLSDADWPAEISQMRGGFAGRLNVYRTMAHHPALLRAWENFRNHCVLESRLTPDQSEVVILRSGFRLGSAYEWAHHVYRGRKIGMSDARILSVKGPLEAMSPEDAALARAVDELFAGHRVSAKTAQDVTDLIGTEGLLDLMATVAHYSLLGFILNSFDVPLDDDVAASLAAAPIET